MTFAPQSAPSSARPLPVTAARGSVAALFTALLAVGAGVLQAWALAWPWAWGPAQGEPLWWLQVWAAVLLFALLGQAGGAWRAAALAWLFALGWLGTATAWLYTSMHVYGGLAAPLAVAGVLALAGFMAAFFALAGFLYKRWALRWRLGAARQGVLLLALWLMAELMRHSWFTGFPWGASAYAHVDGPFAFLAPLVGAYGVGVVAHAFALALWLLLRWAWCSGTALGWATVAAWRAPVLAWLALLLLLMAAPRWWLAWGPERSPSRPPVAVDLLQGNIAQGEKFDMETGVKEALDWYGQALRQSQAKLVVTPETAVPLLPYELPDGYWLGLQQHYASGQRAALVGLPLGDEMVGYRNAVVGLRPSAEATHYAYFKQHLVPFGEFIPPMFRWFTDLMHIPLGDFSRGELVQPSFVWAGERFAPNICYEDLFGQELAARFVGDEPAPTVLVNMSNLGWFGTGLVLDQHLHMARMRSMELDRPSLRATNTGITALIDRHGQVRAALPRSSQGVLGVQVRGNDGLTWYAQWAGRWGHWPLWALAFTLVFLLRWPAPKQKRAKR